MPAYKPPLRSDELYHWSMGKKNHLYVAKIGEGPAAKYFYSQDEYIAYLKNKANNTKAVAPQETKEEKTKKSSGGSGKSGGGKGKGSGKSASKNKDKKSKKSKKSVDLQKKLEKKYKGLVDEILAGLHGEGKALDKFLKKKYGKDASVIKTLVDQRYTDSLTSPSVAAAIEAKKKSGKALAQTTSTKSLSSSAKQISKGKNLVNKLRKK